MSKSEMLSLMPSDRPVNGDRIEPAHGVVAGEDLDIRQVCPGDVEK